MLCIEKDMSDHIDIDIIINDFASKKARKYKKNCFLSCDIVWLPILSLGPFTSIVGLFLPYFCIIIFLINKIYPEVPLCFTLENYS